MQFLLDKTHKDSLFDQAYMQLLSALHMGKLRAGDRLPSVRQIAQRNSINHKTAFAIYQRLQAEGFISLRKGSGAYVWDVDQSDLEQAYSLSLLRLIKSNFAEAARLKIGPREYVKLTQSYVRKAQLKSTRLAVVECNEEQVGLFANEILNRLGITVYPVLLSQLETPDRRAARTLSKAQFFATTHFHFKQVKALTEKYQKKLLQLRLNPRFVPAIVEAARAGPVLMVVSNVNYFPAFKESLINIGTPRALVERITAVDHCDLNRVRARIYKAQTVYISPICDPRARELLTARSLELKFDTTLSGESLEMLEAHILLRSRLP
ncbi:MAG: hypothetical protein QOF02_2452 [Blastocatellia bacterium]|jgi:DNA-binding transcriptional regulator YhcF (GntR family)|nr:hypothetical protein [Blastocatellia bacterium]